jgi:hypothetical protein
MSSNRRVPGMTILPHVCGTYSCPNIMNSKHPTTTLGPALLPPFTAASPTSVTVTEVTADFSGFSAGAGAGSTEALKGSLMRALPLRSRRTTTRLRVQVHRSEMMICRSSSIEILGTRMKPMIRGSILWSLPRMMTVQ